MEKEKKYAKMTDGSQIYYEKSGSGFPLFLLHGNGGNGNFFHNKYRFLNNTSQFI